MGCSGPAVRLIAGEAGRVVRVNDGDLLALDTGQQVRLVEIEAPSPGRGGAPGDPYAGEARSVLSAAALGRTARLYYGGLTRDGYDRALAHVIVSDEAGGRVWLNGLMIRSGAARVRTWPDNSARARQLLELEAAARAAGRGLWGLSRYRILTPREAGSAAGFIIVEGAFTTAFGEARAIARFGEDRIRLALSPALGDPDPAVDLSSAVRIRIRGRLGRGAAAAEMPLTHWAQIESMKEGQQTPGVRTMTTRPAG